MCTDSKRAARLGGMWRAVDDDRHLVLDVRDNPTRTWQPIVEFLCRVAMFGYELLDEEPQILLLSSRRLLPHLVERQSK